MPSTSKKIASVDAQYHCMVIIKDTIKIISDKQVPVNVPAQPVFAKSKEVQMQHHLVFGKGNQGCLLGDLHIEQTLLVLQGKLIKGSGLDSFLSRADFLISGTSTIVDVNDLKVQEDIASKLLPVQLQAS